MWDSLHTHTHHTINQIGVSHTHLVEEELKEPAPFETISQNVPKGQTVPNGPFAPEGLSTLEGQPISDAPST